MAQRSAGRQRGAALGIAAVTAGTLTIIGIGIFVLVSVMGSARENRNASNAGALGVAKAAMRYPYYDLTVNPKGIANAKLFEDVADDSPDGNGHKVVNLESINSIWAKALLVGLNFDSMKAESNVPLPTEAARNVEEMHTAAQQISDELANLLKTDPRTNREFTKIFNTYTAQNSTRKYLNNTDSKTAEYKVSFLERRGRSNAEINLNAVGALTPELQPKVKNWFADGQVLKGYTDEIAINVNGKELRYYFVPISSNAQPHLVSNESFVDNKVPKSGGDSFSWKNAVPNSFSFEGQRRLNGNGTSNQIMTTMVSSLAQSLHGTRKAEMNHGYVVLENAEGLNLDTRTPGPLVTIIGTDPQGSQRNKGVFSAADYANAQLLVQRSVVDPVGGARRDSLGLAPTPDALENEMQSKYGVQALLSALRSPAGLDPYQLVNKIDRADLERVVANLANFGTTPDTKHYPVHALVGALQKNKQDTSLIVRESGLKEFGSLEHLWIQDEQVRDGRRIAGMNVLPYQDHAKAQGETGPLRNRIVSAAFVSPTPLYNGLKVGRDGSPYEYLQGDNLTKKDIVSQYVDQVLSDGQLKSGVTEGLSSEQDKITPTCTLVRWRLVQRIRMIDSQFAHGKGFPEACFDDQLVNLLHHGFGVDRMGSVSGVNPNQLKALPMGTKMVIFKENVMRDGQLLPTVVMKAETESLPEWLAAELKANPQPDGNELLFQGRFFDGTNHKLTNVLINVPGDMSYNKPYYRTADLNARDRFAWYPSTGAKNLLGWLRFETVLNRGNADAAYERQEQTQSDKAINFFQVISRDDSNPDSIKFKDPYDVGGIGQATGCDFFDIYDLTR